MRGSIRRRIARDGKPRYDCIFRSGGKQIWKTFTTRKAADDFLADTVSDVASGAYRRVSARNMADVFTDWLKAIEADIHLGALKRSTFRSYRSVVQKHLAPAFGRYRSDALTAKAITDWKVEQAAMVAAGTVAPKIYNNTIGVLKCALDWAVTQQTIAANPMPTKRLRATVQRDERDIVQAAEIPRLWAAAEGQDRTVVALALFAGLRRGEIFGLRWSDVTLGKGRIRSVIRVQQAFVQRQLVTPKSAAGKRTVNLAPRLVELLRAHMADRPGVLLEDGTAFVVRQDDGKPVDPDNWARRVWPEIRTKAKIPAGVTLHGLRHAFGSLLLADGAPVKHVSEQMGHANPLITMQVYQHVLRATSATATRQLDRHIPAPPTARKPLRLVRTA